MNGNGDRLYVPRKKGGVQDVSSQISVKHQWHWLCCSKFSEETEGTIFTAQEQALSTNAIKANIYIFSRL